MSDIAIRVDHLGKPYRLGAKQHLNMTSSGVTATTVAATAVSLCLFGRLGSIVGAQAEGIARLLRWMQENRNLFA